MHPTPHFLLFFLVKYLILIGRVVIILRSDWSTSLTPQVWGAFTSGMCVVSSGLCVGD